MKKLLKLPILLALGAGLICSAIAQKKEIPGEPKESIQERLKEKVVQEKSGDVHISMPEGRYIFDVIGYVDSGFSMNYLDEEIIKKELKQKELIGDWNSKREGVELYFKKKGMKFDKTAISRRNVQKQINAGIPIIFFYRRIWDHGSNKLDGNWESMFQHFRQRNEKRNEIGDLSKWPKELDKERIAAKKIIKKLGLGSTPGFAYIMGYNEKTKEYLISFLDSRDAPLWIAETELDIIPLEKSLNHVPRTFEF